MFSYLRPSSRRSTTSPAATPSAQTRAYHVDPHYPEDSYFNPPYRAFNQPNPSPISSHPPILPPIPRVASQHESNQKIDVREDSTAEARQSSDKPHERRSPEASKRLSAPTRPEFTTLEEVGKEQYFESAAVPILPATVVPLQHDYQDQTRQLRPPATTFEAMRIHSEPDSRQAKLDAQHVTSNVQPIRLPLPQSSRSFHGATPAAGHIRQGKARLNLLNPMTLLARRRSSQAVTDAAPEKHHQKTPFVPAMALPDDYDPRIRGKVVHDFSAPRLGRIERYSVLGKTTMPRDSELHEPCRLSPKPIDAASEAESFASPEREHAPIFKEHFDDDLHTDGAAKRRTSTFMYQVSLSESQPDPDPSTLPLFARNLPSHLRPTIENPAKPSSPPPKVSLEPVPETIPTNYPMLDKSLPASPPVTPPIKTRSRASSTTEVSTQSIGQPRRFKSNSSRFSFDLAGAGSTAQEKLMEEKHRQQENKRVRRNNGSLGSGFSESVGDNEDLDDSDDGYDNLDDDDGLEERIPGVNADADEPELSAPHRPALNSSLVSPNKSSFTSEVSPISTSMTSIGTPRDSMGLPAGSEVLKASFGIVHNKNHEHSKPLESEIMMAQKADHPHYDADAHTPSVILTATRATDMPTRRNSEDDDLYFDDGVIEDIDEDVGYDFDESVFDDDADRVYGLSLQRTKGLQESGTSNVPYPLEQRTDGDVVNGVARELGVSVAKSPESSGVTCDDRSAHASFSYTAGLTQGNLAAYHDALAFAALQAELNGKFVRHQSMYLEPQTGSSGALNIMPPAASQNENILHFNRGMEDETDNFDFDDALADDPIVAAANAEALENDDEGFYGQEFGFYARAGGSNDAQYANGGYFGARGMEGIGRSHSGRINFQEPSLTPITERSEWSNRNSVISLAMLGYPAPHQSAGSQSSPGLAQLADMMHLEDDSSMSLSALMKLRRGAWGGSNGSLQSSSSGSPLNYAPGVGFPAIPSFSVPMQESNSNGSNANSSPLTANSAQNLASSAYSLNSSNGFASSNDGSDSSPASPTISFTAQQAALPVQQQLVPVLQPGAMYMHPQRSTSPVKRSSMGPPPLPMTQQQQQHRAMGHSRHGSNTSESVSYVMEKGGEWVLEKRRVSEGGTVEVLGRELVEGGRI